MDYERLLREEFGAEDDQIPKDHLSQERVYRGLCALWEATCQMAEAEQRQAREAQGASDKEGRWS